jgi:TRAP-type C4-dicarboxylate transport system permease small subunit
MPAMNATRIVGLLLLIAGALAVAYGGFSYTKETTAVKLGPVELSVKEQERVNVPMWAGIGAIVVGGVLIFVGGKRS